MQIRMESSLHHFLVSIPPPPPNKLPVFRAESLGYRRGGGDETDCRISLTVNRKVFCGGREVFRFPPGGNLGRSHAQHRVNRAAIQGTRPQIYRGKSRESNAEVRFEAPVMGVAKSQIHDTPLHPPPHRNGASLLGLRPAGRHPRATGVTGATRKRGITEMRFDLSLIRVPVSPVTHSFGAKPGRMPRGGNGGDERRRKHDSF